jgi:chaperonin GroES
MRITPQNDYVLIRIDAEEAETSGGLLVPEDARVRPLWGTVLAVGPGRLSKRKRRWIEPDVAVGDRACMKWKTGQDLRVDGRDYKLIREVDIDATISAA